MERLCIQSYVQIQEMSHCVTLDKAAYIFNILLQVIVSPQLSVQCLPSSKRIQKNRFGHYLQEHVISELSKLRVEGGGAALTRADIFFFCYGLKICPVRVTLCMFRHKFHTRTAESIGILVTLQIHNLHLKKTESTMQK